MLSTPKSKGELFLASSLRDGLEDNDIRQVKTLLLSKEADPNVLIPTHGISPFHLVIGNESETFAEEVTKLFLRHGGNPNVKSVDGMTPVHVAAAWGRIRVLELLLANGGDPLCLDDDARSPFHYAFDGAYYEAVSVLGKYCRMNQDEEGSEEDEPKYKLTLDKILINKGDCVAEYVPSEVSCSISVSTENSASLKSEKQEPKEEPETPAKLNFQRNLSPSSDSSTPDEFSHLNSNNITLRRHHKRRGLSNKAAPNLDIAFGEGSVEEERILVGQIINRLSNTFVNESSAIGKNAITCSRKTINNRANNTSEIKSRPSFLPPPKYHSSNLKSKATPRRLLADTSIISKSPNFHIGNDKTPSWSKKNAPSPKSYTCRSTYYNKNATPPSRSSKPSEVRIRSASSTPKKKQYFSRLSGSVKLPKTEKFGYHALEEKRIKARTIFDKTYDKGRTIFDKTYCKDQFGVPSYSPDTEITERLSKVDRKLLAKNIAIKLDDRLYDENLDNKIYESSPRRKINVESPSNNLTKGLKPPHIYNNIKTDIKVENAKRCNVASSESKAASPRNLVQDEKINNKFSTPKKRVPVTPKTEIVKFSPKRESKSVDSCDDDPEKLREFFESPGSKNPVSVSRLEYSRLIGRKIEKNLDDEEEEEDTKIWLEIDEALKIRCGTPPASVSILDADYSPNSTNCSSEQATSTTFYSDYGSEYTSTSEFNEAFMNNPKVALNPGIMAMRSCTESFVSMDEEYTYEDTEEGVIFIERRLRVIPSSMDDQRNNVKSEDSWVDRFEELSLVTSDYSRASSPQGALTKSLLDDQILRERLTALGEMPGPITKTTYNVYLKRLWRLERAQKDSSKSIKPPNGNIQQTNQRTTMSKAIPEFLRQTDWETKLDLYRNLEEQAFKEYSTANPSRKYRGGISKSSFCYLLLDPRVTKDLPRSGVNLSVEDRWIRFLEGIFYVGKGKAARPAAHLYDAFGIWSKRKQSENLSRKIRRILDIWEDGQGVVCLHVFSHTMLEEACSREAAMIDALDTAHLTNCVRGSYYGYTTTMNNQEKRSLGKYLLYKAMEIFMHEGERQLFPRNVIL